MKRIAYGTLVLSLSCLVACGMDSPSADSFRGADANPGGSRKNAGEASNSGAVPGSTGSSEAAPPDQGKGTPGAQAGQLTAGVWDDNLNFDFFKTYVNLSGSLGGLPSFTLQERETARSRWAQRTASNELDIAFLIDTTGSMGDELSYLQAEIDNIATTIATKFPQTTPRYGLVLYKDKDDPYVTRSFDFTTVGEFKTKLAEQTVGGGGDFPEAVPEGLGSLLQLGWRTGAVARMAFWVADAPHHMGEEGTVRQHIDNAAARDIHVYPVAASGTDPRAEFTMRSAAQMTGGRYVFLTDDSGIGNDHAEPHIPCYHVTKFNGAIVRMVESEMRGTRIAPTATEIIRSVGNPQNEQCVTKSQGNVSIY